MGEPRDQYLLSISVRMSCSEDAMKEFLLGEEAPNPNSPTMHNDEDEQINSETLSYFNNLSLLWERKVFVYTMLSISALYFVVTGIQFWISDYLRAVLLVPKEQVFIFFSAVSITAPTMGVLFGGSVVSRYGGYSSKSALKICCIFATTASVFALPIPFINDFTTLVVFLWFLLFFGGALMPPVMGIMLSSIPKSLRAFGNSAAQIFQNLLGYFPAPFLYGFVYNVTGGDKEQSRWGMIMLMFWSVFGIVGLYQAKLYQDDLSVKRMERVKRHDYIELETAATEPENGSKKDDEYAPPLMKQAAKNRHAHMRNLVRPNSDNEVPIGRDRQVIKELKHAVIDYNMLPTEDNRLLTQENLENLGVLLGRARPTLRRNTLSKPAEPFL